MRTLLFVCAILLALPAGASTIWGRDCAHTQANSVAAPARPVTLIGAGELGPTLPRFACLGWGQTGVTSQVLTISAESALFCFVDDVAGTSATATVMLQKCVGDTNITPTDSQSCLDLLDTALVGAEGAAGTQTACLRVGPGRYRAITVAGADGDFPVLTVEAE